MVWLGLGGVLGVVVMVVVVRADADGVDHFVGDDDLVLVEEDVGGIGVLGALDGDGGLDTIVQGPHATESVVHYSGKLDVLVPDHSASGLVDLEVGDVVTAMDQSQRLQVQIQVQDVCNHDIVGRSEAQVLESNGVVQRLCFLDGAVEVAAPWVHRLVIGVARAGILVQDAGHVVRCVGATPCIELGDRLPAADRDAVDVHRNGELTDVSRAHEVEVIGDDPLALLQDGRLGGDAGAEGGPVVVHSFWQCDRDGRAENTRRPRGSLVAKHDGVQPVVARTWAVEGHAIALDVGACTRVAPGDVDDALAGGLQAEVQVPVFDDGVDIVHLGNAATEVDGLQVGAVDHGDVPQAIGQVHFEDAVGIGDRIAGLLTGQISPHEDPRGARFAVVQTVLVVVEVHASGDGTTPLVNGVVVAVERVVFADVEVVGDPVAVVVFVRVIEGLGGAQRGGIGCVGPHLAASEQDPPVCQRRGGVSEARRVEPTALRPGVDFRVVEVRPPGDWPATGDEDVSVVGARFDAGEELASTSGSRALAGFTEGSSDAEGLRGRVIEVTAGVEQVAPGDGRAVQAGTHQHLALVWTCGQQGRAMIEVAAVHIGQRDPAAVDVGVRRREVGNVELGGVAEQAARIGRATAGRQYRAVREHGEGVLMTVDIHVGDGNELIGLRIVDPGLLSRTTILT